MHVLNPQSGGVSRSAAVAEKCAANVFSKAGAVIKRTHASDVVRSAGHAARRPSAAGVIADPSDDFDIDINECHVADDPGNAAEEASVLTSGGYALDTQTRHSTNLVG